MDGQKNSSEGHGTKKLKNQNLPKLAIFDTFKTKPDELTGEAKRQRSIISHLVSESGPTEKTRTAISQKIANENKIDWKNIYSGIFHDLDKVLVPLEIVEEAGRLPLKRGPKALQDKGIPHYQLTQRGLIVALALREIKNRDGVLKNFLANANMKNDFSKDIKKLHEIVPKFIFSLFEKYVQGYCKGKIEYLIPLTIQQLKKISDESIEIQREFLEGFIALEKEERSKIQRFLKEIT